LIKNILPKNINDPVEMAINNKKRYVSCLKNNELICENINAVNPNNASGAPSAIPRNDLKFVTYN